MTTAELLARMLDAAGVRWVFGIPSGPVLPLIEALRRSPIEFVLTASETSAGFMAQTVGALTGVPGVCVSTLGPGATNLATGIGGAWLDRAPVIAITCNVATPWLDRRVQMRIDHHALFRPLVKATFAVRAESAGETLARALALSSAEPPGPVHLDLPEDAAHEKAAEDSQLPSRNAVPFSNVEADLSKELEAALRLRRKPLV
ncbi:MAG: thiamine pyrophosphate-binding protein, partial [Candidatus Binatia bacterium]